MTTDLIAGVIPVGIDVITSYLPFFKSGQLVPLAVTSAVRSPLLPDVPTMAELGKRNLTLENFFGLSGPAKMPQDVVASLQSACAQVMAQPEIKQKLTDLGISWTPLSTPAFQAFVKNQVDVLGPAVKGAGVRL
jgi:tripartite-type tricarboxylate transporter receptor subunit TctC